jgi:cyclohexanone monooxygenase
MSTHSSQEALDAVIVGGGFAGLFMLHRLRQMGMRARILEAGSDVGGTWYWNRYPGCRCDVESLEYSYSFDDGLQQSWKWSERYASQPEILSYARHVAERFGLRGDIDFDTRVASARYEESRGKWDVTTTTGRVVSARFCIMATGSLSAGRVPEFPDLDQFEGEVYHTSTWPQHGVEFAGKRVAVMGVGSSGVQAIPLIAKEAKKLHVLLRTPNYVVPARNGPLDEIEAGRVIENYAALRKAALSCRGGVLLRVRDESGLAVDEAEREREFEKRWQMGGAFNFVSAFNDLQTNVDVNRMASDFVRGKIGQIVQNPVWSRWLQPEHLLGTRRLCVGTDYYETYNRDNVSLENLRLEPLLRFTPRGVQIGNREIALDTMVFATGFDALTGALSSIDIKGRDRRRLTDHWRAGPRTMLGLMTAGFPNLFLLTGPGSPSVLTNVLMSIEQHVNWVARCLADLTGADLRIIEPSSDAEAEWSEHVQSVGAKTLFAGGDSWYVGANVPGKPRVVLPYAGGLPAYTQHCARIAAENYPGFVRS